MNFYDDVVFKVRLDYTQLDLNIGVSEARSLYEEIIAPDAARALEYAVSALSQSQPNYIKIWQIKTHVEMQNAEFRGQLSSTYKPHG